MTTEAVELKPRTFPSDWIANDAWAFTEADHVENELGYVEPWYPNDRLITIIRIDATRGRYVALGTSGDAPQFTEISLAGLTWYRKLRHVWFGRLMRLRSRAKDGALCFEPTCEERIRYASPALDQFSCEAHGPLEYGWDFAEKKAIDPS